MEQKHLNELYALQAMESSDYAMRWYGWGSPVGLSIFFLTLTAIAIAIKMVFFG